LRHWPTREVESGMVVQFAPDPSRSCYLVIWTSWRRAHRPRATLTNRSGLERRIFIM